MSISSVFWKIVLKIYTVFLAILFSVCHNGKSKERTLLSKILTQDKPLPRKEKCKNGSVRKGYELKFEENFSGGLEANKWVDFDETVKAHSAKKYNDFVPNHVITQGSAKHEGSNMHYNPENVAVKDGGLVITAGRDGCPAVGPEIDVLEMFGDDSYLAFNLHSWWKGGHINYLDGQGYHKKAYLPNGAKFSEFKK